MTHATLFHLHYYNKFNLANRLPTQRFASLIIIITINALVHVRIFAVTDVTTILAVAFTATLVTFSMQDSVA